MDGYLFFLDGGINGFSIAAGIATGAGLVIGGMPLLLAAAVGIPSIALCRFGVNLFENARINKIHGVRLSRR